MWFFMEFLLFVIQNLYVHYYRYSLSGLSPEKMRVLLHPIIQSEGRYVFDGLGQLSRDSDHGADVVLWETRDSTDGKWKTAEVVYTCRHPHQVM